MWRLLISLLSVSAVFANDKDWWKYTEIYEVFIASFQDSNGDGIGDLKGVTSRVDHFAELGIGSVWLSPFFKSPMVDFGYDISNFTDVEPRFGTLSDFDELSRELKKRGIKVFLDCVINHSSDEHPWFRLSIDRVKPYDNYYVWKDPKGYSSSGQPIPPNNWQSIFDGSAWEWNDKRKQFYLHQFGKKQPDFNLRDPALKKELKAILNFWFDKGVSGMRLDATTQYMEDIQLRDEPLWNPNDNKDEHFWMDYNHIYTTNLWESYEFIHELRQHVDEINEKQGGPERILVVEAWTDRNNTMAYYGTKEYAIAHFPFNFGLILLRTFQDAVSIFNFVNDWTINLPETGVPNWVAENHDTVRTSTRTSEEYADVTTFLMMTLPGVACLYYGQEIGMPDGPIRPDQVQDHLRGVERDRLSRDSVRVPMQWDDTLNSGFSSKRKPWLPVNPNYWYLNVEAQKADPNSRLNIFKTLTKFRRTQIAKYGNIQSYVLSTWVFAFTRTISRETYAVVCNLGTEMEMINLAAEINTLPPTMKVLIGTPNSGYKKGTIVKKSSKFPKIFVLKPTSCVLLTSNLKNALEEDEEEV